MEIGENPVVMLVEDDFVDVEIVRRGFKKRNLNYDLVVKEDGAEALSFLRECQFSRTRRKKLVVFLDINMPGMNGHQFLEELRNDPELRNTIVFMLTTSDHERDISQAYAKNVAGYFVKSNVDGLLDTFTNFAGNVEYPPAK